MLFSVKHNLVLVNQKIGGGGGGREERNIKKHYLYFIIDL